MYRIALECLSVPVDDGDEAAADIERNFQEHRPHHQNVRCTFENGRLILGAENDFDPDGLALLDEFSDCVSAYLATLFDGDVRIVSSTNAWTASAKCLRLGEARSPPPSPLPTPPLSYGG